MEKKQQVDFIIVGQGLAGTLLSYFLLLENQRVVVLDYSHEGRTSNIAAGLVNPITGRRLAKSWRFEELAAFAKQTYQSLEGQLGVQLWHDRRIVRALHNTFEENEWMRRSGYPEFQAFMSDGPEMTEFEGKIHEPFGWGELRNCAQVAMTVLVERWRGHLLREGHFFMENIDYQRIEFVENQVHYGGWAARKLIFCEGAKALENPFFNHLPFLATKGELLLVKIPGCQFGRILKQHIFLVPQGGEVYWVGSTSRYEFEGPSPSEASYNWLISELDKTLTVPYQVIKHLAGIRPTVADIRPFLGLNEAHPELGIFNGLGTKGALLGPFFAKQMADFLLGKGELEPDVDIKRFMGLMKSGHFFTKEKPV